jgi:hypothetical protein
LRTQKSEPRILLYDLETTHNILAAFNLYGKDYIPHDNILQERYIVCASWIWFDEDKVHSVSVLDDPKRYKKNPHDDTYVVDAMSKAIEEADIIVAHNGDKYDKPFLAGRRLALGRKPLPPVRSIDTLKIARRNFLLNSNRLDYIAKLLKVGGKKHTSPGLWLRVLSGDKKAINEMVEYNKVDLIILKGVFKKMLGYLPDINYQLYGNGVCCPKCGSKSVQRRGTHVALTRTYQRYQCQNELCGGWFKEGKPERSTSARSI